MSIKGIEIEQKSEQKKNKNQKPKTPPKKQKDD